MTNEEFKTVSNVLFAAVAGLLLTIMSINFNDRLRKIEQGSGVPEGIAVVYSGGRALIEGHTHLDSMLHMNCEGCAGFLMTPEQVVDINLVSLARLGYAMPSQGNSKKLLPSKGGQWQPTLSGKAIQQAIDDAVTTRETEVEEE